MNAAISVEFAVRLLHGWGTCVDGLSIYDGDADAIRCLHTAELSGSDIDTCRDENTIPAAFIEDCKGHIDLLCNRANNLSILPGFFLCGSCDRSSKHRLRSLILHLLVRS